MTQYVGEIRLFGGNFEPAGWFFCQGQLLPISEYDVLFTLIGTTYGGDGQATFALPNLGGRLPIHEGTGGGLSPRTIGEIGGQEAVTLTAAQNAAHTHTYVASNAVATTRSPANQVLAKTAGISAYFDPPADPVNMRPTAPSLGGSQPHENRQPFLCVSFIIAYTGIFPPRS